MDLLRAPLSLSDTFTPRTQQDCRPRRLKGRSRPRMLAPQLERGLPLALRAGRGRRRAQRRDVLGSEVGRVVELAGRARRGLRIAGGLEQVELADQALRLEQLRIEEHRALEIVLRRLQIGSFAVAGHRRQRAGQVAEAAAHHEHRVGVVRERPAEPLEARDIDGDARLRPRLAHRVAEDPVVARRRPALEALARDARRALLDLPDQHRDPEHLAGAVVPAGDHVLRAGLHAVRRDGVGLGREPPRRGRRTAPRPRRARARSPISPRSRTASRRPSTRATCR